MIFHLLNLLTRFLLELINSFILETVIAIIIIDKACLFIFLLDVVFWWIYGIEYLKFGKFVTLTDIPALIVSFDFSSWSRGIINAILV